MKLKMKAVFLCGGVGKRMYPFSEDKVLLKFLGKTLLEHQLTTAQRAGLNQFVIIGNPGNIKRLKSVAGRIKGIETEFVIQKIPGGIGHALQSARKALEGRVVIVNPNDLFDSSIYETLLHARNKKTGSILPAYEVKEYFPGGYLVADQRGTLAGIVEKPIPGKEPSNLVTMLIHLHNDAGTLLEYIDRQPAGRDDVYERAISAMAMETKSVKVVKYRGEWTAIKYPWNILDAARYYLDNAAVYVAPTARISGKATLEGKIILDDNVRVLENAVIRGPAYIGKNSVIGNNCLVRNYSHIGASCTVGFGTEIKGSYLGDGCMTHMNYIGDSAVGDNCNFGAGTITANWRFD
jgi:UDP-N-acetylglucosamine diphosphorylase / glucose-1-phosphate thymidylyltransferase / UDP-N-acetylgalactosamine diphosphorylase / glucosamine-1-phosphate N-acetyltransferase / galactosamine-1-phosphate N-acetyltransferase